MMPWLVFLVTLLIVPGLAAESRIELEDGSLLSGEVLDSDGQRYRIRSATLGILEIDAARIRAIELDGTASHPERSDSAQQSASQHIESLQKQLAGNQDLLGKIMALQNDPDIRRVLDDKALLNAIARRDLDQLRQHPSIQKLLDNPQLRVIIDQLHSP